LNSMLKSSKQMHTETFESIQYLAVITRTQLRNFLRRQLPAAQ